MCDVAVQEEAPPARIKRVILEPREQRRRLICRLALGDPSHGDADPVVGAPRGLLLSEGDAVRHFFVAELLSGEHPDPRSRATTGSPVTPVAVARPARTTSPSSGRSIFR